MLGNPASEAYQVCVSRPLGLWSPKSTSATACPVSCPAWLVHTIPGTDSVSQPVVG